MPFTQFQYYRCNSINADIVKYRSHKRSLSVSLAGSVNWSTRPVFLGRKSPWNAQDNVPAPLQVHRVVWTRKVRASKRRYTYEFSHTFRRRSCTNRKSWSTVFFHPNTHPLFFQTHSAIYSAWAHKYRWKSERQTRRTERERWIERASKWERGGGGSGCRSLALEHDYLMDYRAEGSTKSVCLFSGLLMKSQIPAKSQRNLLKVFSAHARNRDRPRQRNRHREKRGGWVGQKA